MEQGAEWPFEGNKPSPRACSETRGGRSRGSISQRASMAQAISGLSEHSRVNWSEEIRRRCGKELLLRRHVPAKKIFQECQLSGTAFEDSRLERLAARR